MIKSFKCADTQTLFERTSVRRFAAFEPQARKRLLILDAATDLLDLRVPPSNRLEALKGKRKGQYSIRVNKQWRVCFTFENGNAYDVEIVDYH